MFRGSVGFKGEGVCLIEPPLKPDYFIFIGNFKKDC